MPYLSCASVSEPITPPEVITARLASANGSPRGDTGGKVSTERVDNLKREIALTHYEVDAAAVAEAIVAKLQLVRRGRLALTGTDAGQIPLPGQANVPHP